MMSRWSSWETKHDDDDDDDDEGSHSDYSDEEIRSRSSCSCGLIIGFKRNNQVFDIDHSLSRLSLSEEEDSEEEELFEINLKKKKEPLDAITEEEEDDDCESTVFSLDIHDNNNDDVVYVAVGHRGRDHSSMEALSWALKHAVTPSTTVSLLHVFPQLKLIPTPCKSVLFFFIINLYPRLMVTVN